MESISSLTHVNLVAILQDPLIAFSTELVTKDDSRIRVIKRHNYLTVCTRVNYKSKRYYQMLGRYPGCNLNIIKRKAAEYISNVLSGNALANIKFEEFINKHFLSYIANHRTSFQSDSSRLRALITQFGRCNLASITVLHVSEYLNGLNVANSTHNRFRALLSRILSLAVELGLLQTNPVSKTHQKREANVRNRVLSPDEIASFMQHAENDIDPVASIAIRLCLFTGLRLSNVLSINKEDINLGTHSLYVPITKNGTSQTVVLNTTARTFINDALSLGYQSNWLFPNENNPSINIKSLRSIKKRIQARMIVDGFNEHFTLHDLRRSFATYLAKGCGDMRIVQTALNHSSLNVTARYVHHDQKTMLDASESASQLMTRISDVNSISNNKGTR